MVSIAEPIAKPATPFRFILDRPDVLGSVLVAPAILYVLLLVGMPFLLAVYYSVSAYTIYNPSWRFVGLTNFEDILENPIFLQTLGNTFLFTFSSCCSCSLRLQLVSLPMARSVASCWIRRNV